MKKNNEKPSKVSLRGLFLHLQEQMISALSTDRAVLYHPGTKGDAAEAHWREMLTKYLPKRYCADKAMVVDCDGRVSEQIDVVIYDRQYSPFLFNQDRAKYVPAESVYAVFETKQEINAQYIEYAQAKAASVRRLRRTSVPIHYAGGIYKPRKPQKILAGILALESSWHPPLGKPFREALKKARPSGRLDLGCALKHGAFEAKYPRVKAVALAESTPETSLIFFVLRLLAALQKCGTASALDLDMYGRALKGTA